MDTYPISSNSLEKFYYIDGRQLSQQYKNHLSDYRQWAQQEHAQQWILFPENIGTNISIDETSISNSQRPSNLLLLDSLVFLQGRYGVQFFFVHPEKLFTFAQLFDQPFNKQPLLVKRF